MITEDVVLYLNSHYEQRLKRLTVRRLLTGRNFTAVQLSDGTCGLAGNDFHPGKMMDHPKERLLGKFAPGNIQGSVIYELLNFNDDARIPVAVKVAVINAVSSGLLTQNQYQIVEDTDTLDLLNLSGKKNITIVGAFHNYIQKLQNTDHDVRVVELREKALNEEQLPLYVPYADSKDILSDSDIVLITGSSVINKTLDHLLSMCSEKSVIALVGPSGGMIPDMLFSRGVDIIGTTRITDPDEMFVIIGEGGSGYHLFGKCAKKICVINDKISHGKLKKNM